MGLPSLRRQSALPSLSQPAELGLAPLAGLGRLCPEGLCKYAGGVVSAFDVEVAEPDDFEEEYDEGVFGRRILTKSIDEASGYTVDRIRRGRLILQPEFQRQYVWPKSKASALIESMLLGIPLPVFYMAELPNGKWEAVDGQQRLTSIHAFIEGRYPDGAAARLTRLRVRKDLNGKTFKDLAFEDQESIENYSLRIVLIQKEADPDLKYEVFERLNSGSQILSDMELRNCIYRGPYNNLLRELASNRHLLLIRGATKPDEKMKDRQYILRFFAMCRKTHLQYRYPVRKMLNEEMETFRFGPPDELARLKKLFDDAIECAYIVFGSHAFRRYNFGNRDGVDGHWPTAGTINVALWDTMLYSFSLFEKRQIVASADSIREEFLDLLTHDDVFLDYIGRTTDKTDRVRYRADTWISRLRTVIGTPSTEPRVFSRALKVRLYNADPSCALCGQYIQDINDAELDHVTHYWRGGATIPENARLTHRYCNRLRGGRE